MSLNLDTVAPQGRIGGSFAPPLTPAKLESYKELARTAAPQVGESMQKLIAMVEEFQKTPESKLPGTPHPVGPAIGIDGKHRNPPSIVPLEEGEIKRMWDHIPWGDELNMMDDLFEREGKAATESNSTKIQAWNIAVIEALHKKHFPDRTLFEKLSAMVKKAAEFAGFLTPDAEAQIAEHKAKLKVYEDEVAFCFRRKECPGVPRPVLDSTEVRDAAKHLLWFAVELYKDREPTTLDKL